MSGVWTKTEVERLRQLARTYSSGECALILTREFGRPVSRSAIAGRCQRLGVKIRGGPAAANLLGRKPRPIQAPPLPALPPASFLEVTGCRYPVNSGQPHLFCNARMSRKGEIADWLRRTSPRYCAKHALAAASKSRRSIGLSHAGGNRQCA